MVKLSFIKKIHLSMNLRLFSTNTSDLNILINKLNHINPTYKKIVKNNDLLKNSIFKDKKKQQDIKIKSNYNFYQSDKMIG